MFDDPAHAAWAIANPNPTLATFTQRLRPLVRSNPQGMFSSHVFRRFVDHPALADNSAVLELMNKAHHGRRQEIRAADVAQCANTLEELLEIVEQMSDECYRWRRRDTLPGQSNIPTLGSLVPLERPDREILILPDLAAFTQHGSAEGSREIIEKLDKSILENKSASYLRRPNFGFAAGQGSIALVEAFPGPAGDRRLVIVRHGSAVYARRLVRSANGPTLGLTAEIPDPRQRSPKTIIVSETEVAVHQVVGIIFEHAIAVQQGNEEAVQIDASNALNKVQIAYRVIDDSAVPLALPKQVVLGGARIELAELGLHEGALVALTLDDNSSIFKRVGLALPEPLGHLRQFESIGGLGASQILSVGKVHRGILGVTSARSIVGVLYHG